MYDQSNPPQKDRASSPTTAFMARVSWHMRGSQRIPARFGAKGLEFRVLGLRV